MLLNQQSEEIYRHLKNAVFKACSWGAAKLSDIRLEPDMLEKSSKTFTIN